MSSSVAISSSGVSSGSRDDFGRHNLFDALARDGKFVRVPPAYRLDPPGSVLSVLTPRAEANRPR
jgi:hypothetical protein